MPPKEWMEAEEEHDLLSLPSPEMPPKSWDQAQEDRDLQIAVMARYCFPQPLCE